MCGECPYLGDKYFCHGCFQATNNMTTGLGRGADWGPWGARGTAGCTAPLGSGHMRGTSELLHAVWGS